MGYSSYKNHQSFTDDKNVVIDGCGNTYEDKYYYNGTYIDLCGLPIEEYMKNHFFCDNNTGGGSTNTKPTNKITIESYEEEGIVYYRAVSTAPVTEKLKISVMSNDGSTTVLDIEIGETTSKPEKGETLDIKNVSLNVYEDDTYVYSTQIKVNKSMYKIYSKSLLLNEFNNITNLINEFNSFETEVNKTKEITFIIPGTDYNYNDVEVEEFNKFVKENQYCLVLCLPNDVYENKQYFIYLDEINNTDSFINKKTIDIKGEKYIVLVKQAEVGNEEIFTPVYQEEKPFVYKLTLK